MKTTMRACDNNACGELSDDGYGWIKGELQRFGNGPSLEIEVCSPECLESGFRQREYLHEIDEHAASHARSKLLQESILSISCNRCASPAGVACVSINGNRLLNPHAVRRNAGRKIARELRESQEAS